MKTLVTPEPIALAPPLAGLTEFWSILCRDPRGRTFWLHLDRQNYPTRDLAWNAAKEIARHS